MDRALLLLLAEQIEEIRKVVEEVMHDDRAHGRVSHQVSVHLDEMRRRSVDIEESVAVVEKALGEEAPHGG